MTYTCPVCGYQNLPFPPLDYEICPSCGTEFEYHDARRTHAELRENWIRAGALWHSSVVPKPYGWNPVLQLVDAGLLESVPYNIPTPSSGSVQETQVSVPGNDMRLVSMS
jgi:hypothetical protein